MTYRHTQTGFLPLTIVGLVPMAIVVAAFAGWTDELGGPWWYALWVTIAMLLAAVLVGVSRLTVTVDANTVTASFRFGWPVRRIVRAEIVSVRRVQVRWYHGWGIRIVPRGTMYNVAGFDAVELELRSGRVFWIGTDDPDGLVAALA